VGRDPLVLIQYLTIQSTKTQDVGYYVKLTARTCLIAISCVLSPSGSLTRISTDSSTTWAYRSVDCREYFVDSGAPGRVVRAESMASQMVHFPSSMALPEPGQIFMVGSMALVIGPDGNGEIVEAVQDHPAPIAPTAATTSLILAVTPRVLATC